jgi:hypothetical protein
LETVGIVSPLSHAHVPPAEPPESEEADSAAP